jgi:DNA-binding transcriptional MerR regulator
MEKDGPAADLGIGELARRSGVSVDTIRLYDRRGLLPGVRRGANGYRRFPVAAIARVEAIRGALALGFRLRELAPLFAERDRGGSPCRRTLTLAEDRLAGVRRELADLRRVERRLASLVAAWRERVASLTSGERAHLLHELDRAPTAGRPSRRTPSARGRRKASP